MAHKRPVNIYIYIHVYIHVSEYIKAIEENTEDGTDNQQTLPALPTLPGVNLDTLTNPLNLGSE